MRIWAALFLLVVACGGTPPPTPRLDTGVRQLKPDQVVDGIPCLTSDLPVVHNHVHLAVYMDGDAVTVPAGIGVGKPWGVDSTGFIATGACFAWLHTHDTSGLVHIYSSVDRTFTLLDLFDIWGHPLGSGFALGYHGRMAVLDNGRPVTGDPASVQLTNFHNLVIELGRPPSVPPPALYDFASPRA